MLYLSILMQDIDSNQSYGYKVGPKTDKEKAKEAVEALHEPDHWQRYYNCNSRYESELNAGLLIVISS